MRLVNTHSLQLEEFIHESSTSYAILSHTWGQEEVLFPDMTDLDKARGKAGFAKVQGACTLAASQGHDYIWIDTCCIDKSSSAELSEAINSMYQWYESSKVCYAYLSDVENPARLGDSRWFTRGWTLQELVAPKRVEFYTSRWTYIGEKQDSQLISTISQASLVDECVLARIQLPQYVSVAKRMYWASRRKTTRPEDEAYCLMGLFMVNMPLLYGEGGRAFFRLQREITSITNDQSILAWYCYSPIPRYESESWYMSCCAPSPSSFALSGSIMSLSNGDWVAERPRNIEYTGTGKVEFSAILGDLKPGEVQEVILHCQIGPVPGTYPTLLLRGSRTSRRYSRFIRNGVVTQLSLHGPSQLLAHRGILPPSEVPLRAKKTKPLGLWISRTGSREPTDGVSRIVFRDSTLPVNVL